MLSCLSSLVDVGATAREFGAFQRPRGVRSPEDQLRLVLAYGVGLSLRQGSAWSGAAGIAEVSNPALLRRLSQSADWIEHLALQLVEDAKVQPSGEWAGRQLRLIDATSLSRPGDNGASWRLHVSYDLTGRVDGLQLTDGKGAESLGRFAWHKGDLVIGDRGYAKAKDFPEVVAAGADFVVRTGWNALRLRDAQGQPFDLFATLAGLGPAGKCWVPTSVAVWLETPGEAQASLPVRLIIDRLPEAQAQEARERVRANASKKGRKIDPRTLEAAGYVMLLTSLPEARSATAILALYRLRWQIELLFKRFKSLIGLGELPAKSPKLARTWIFAKLIIALLADKMARQVADSPP